MNRKQQIRLAIVLGLAVLGIGLVIALRKADVQPTSSQLRVAATYYPLYEFTRQVAGDRAAVRVITPTGTEPHEYEPTPKQLADTATSDVLVYNGAGIDPWVDGVLDGYKGTPVNASSAVDLLPASEDHEHEAASDPHDDHGSNDPHFWLDPVAAQAVVTQIARSLSDARPDDAAYFTQRANAYNAQLAELDASFAKGLSQCAQRTIVTSHAAFGYLAKRYTITVLPIAGLSPEAEPSTEQLAEISTLVREKQLQYVFFESLVSPKLADTIAQETGAQTLVFDPIEGLSEADQSDGKDYLSVQKQNLENLRRALNCT